MRREGFLNGRVRAACFLAGFIVVHVAGPVRGVPLSADDAVLRSYIRDIESVTRYRRERAAAWLRKSDTAGVLRAFKGSFGSLTYEGKSQFCKEVLPYLAGKDVNEFFVKEVREGCGVQLKIQELQRRERENAATREEIASAYNELKNEYEWWQWVVRFGGGLRHIPGYEEVYKMMLQVEEAGMVGPFAEELHRRDGQRTERDIERVLLDGDVKMQRVGVLGLRALRIVPSAEAAQKFFQSADVAVLDEADQILLFMRREHLELLLSLVGSRSARVRSMAEYQLGRLGRLTRRQEREVSDGAGTAEARVKAWLQWWEQHRNDSEETLRRRAAAGQANRAKDELTANILKALSEYGDLAEVYPVFGDALSSSNAGLRKQSAMYLSVMAADGHGTAVETLIEHCQKVSVEQWSEYAEYVLRIQDGRIEKLFADALKKGGDQDTAWKRRVVGALCETHSACFLRVLIGLVVEQGNVAAAQALGQVEGSEQAVGELLQAMLREPDYNKRRAIREAIKSVGCEGLERELTRVLAEASGSSRERPGPRYDVLQLMEVFADAGAKNSLLGLLKSKYPWDVLGAARVLGRVGDDSGTEPLIAMLGADIDISQRSVKNHIGEALRAINSPRTRRLLERVYRDAEPEVKKAVLEVMGEQGDPNYLDFLGKQMEVGSSEIAGAARGAVVVLMHSCRKEKSEVPEMVKENDLGPIRKMLLWAFFDERIREGDEAFVGHNSLKKFKGAVIRVNPYQCIEFACADRQVRLEAAKANNGMTVGRGESYCSGDLSRSDLGQYIYVFLSLNNGGCGYLFKRDGDKWVPIGAAGGVRWKQRGVGEKVWAGER